MKPAIAFVCSGERYENKPEVVEQVTYMHSGVVVVVKKIGKKPHEGVDERIRGYADRAPISQLCSSEAHKLFQDPPLARIRCVHHCKESKERNVIFCVHIRPWLD